jgi:hypothetical protein
MLSQLNVVHFSNSVSLMLMLMFYSCLYLNFKIYIRQAYLVVLIGLMEFYNKLLMMMMMMMMMVMKECCESDKI